MNYKLIGHYVSNMLLLEAFFMVPALLIGVFCGEYAAARSFGFTMLLLLVVGWGLRLLCRRTTDKSFYVREGMMCVGLCWCVLSLFGCLPFYLSGEIPQFIDALFETVSGFTTTGASILPDVESLSRSIIYWRSFTHWLGGMGVLVFLLILAPAKGYGGGFTIHLLRAESPGPSVDKLVPRIRDTAKILYLLYIVLTVIAFLFYLFGGMSVFDAVCTTFGTAGTGGFGIKNNSMAGYSPYLQNVCAVFMLLFGINFSCYYLLLLRQFGRVFRDEELRFYLGVILLSVLLITINVRGLYSSVGETIRHAFFQVSSIITTTGFATTDFDRWPSFSKSILMCLTMIGGCAGSTAGGLKCSRLLLLIKSLGRNVHQSVRPNDVRVVRNNGRTVEERVLQNTNAYLAAYIIIIVLSIILISLDEQSITTNISSVVTCFNNVGPGFDAVGPTCNFGLFSLPSKIVLIVDMLAGRLEIFPILTLFTKSMWKHR